MTAPGENAGRPLVVLAGPPAAGKSVVGKLLSGRLNASFVDTDAEIEAWLGERARTP